MPIHTEVVTAQVEKTTGVTCDCCGEYFDADDVLEMQEMHVFHFTGGFGSIWGDGTTVDCVLCQVCTKNLISPFARIQKG